MPCRIRVICLRKYTPTFKHWRRPHTTAPNTFRHLFHYYQCLHRRSPDQSTPDLNCEINFSLWIVLRLLEELSLCIYIFRLRSLLLPPHSCQIVALRALTPIASTTSLRSLDRYSDGARRVTAPEFAADIVSHRHLSGRSVGSREPLLQICHANLVKSGFANFDAKRPSVK